MLIVFFIFVTPISFLVRIFGKDLLGLKLNKEQGMTIILVEQKLPFARAVGENFHLMEKGQVVASGAMEELDDELVGQYLAV